MSSRWIVAGLALCVAAFFILRPPSTGVGAEAKDFKLYNERSRPVTLSELRGKVVVLDFWASWCGPCRMAMPAMQRLHETYGKRGAVVMGINVNDDKDPVQFMFEQGHTYTTLLNGEGVGGEYGLRGIPMLMVIGPTGKILFKQSGWAPQFEGQMAAIIEAELANASK
jgi:thiol-disulfide isomerase/thioredoxin